MNKLASKNNQQNNTLLVVGRKQLWNEKKVAIAKDNER